MTKREQKIKQLRERGWSEARIKSHMYHWDGFEKRVKPKKGERGEQD